MRCSSITNVGREPEDLRDLGGGELVPDDQCDDLAVDVGEVVERVMQPFLLLTEWSRSQGVSCPDLVRECVGGRREPVPPLVRSSQHVPRDAE